MITAAEITKRTGINIIHQQLAYIMRSGAPASLDRMVAVSFGNLALDQVAMGHTGRMVRLPPVRWTVDDLGDQFRTGWLLSWLTGER